MAEPQRKAFNGRAFISTLTGVSFLGMSITGIILFVVPPGRVANWTGWTIFGLTKAQWQGLHIWWSLIFMAAGAVHLYYNWRPFVSYFKTKVGTMRALRWEWILSVVLCLLISVATLGRVPPFSSLLEWGEEIKYSWDERGRRAPIPHAELMTLSELAQQVEGITVETMIANLAAHDVAVESPEQVVGELAEAHGMTPERLYRIATGQTQDGHGAGYGGGRGAGGGGGGHGMGGGSGGAGFGRMTLEQYCQQTGIDTQAAIEKLRQAGIEATETTTIREIADAAGVRPSAVGSLLE
jgi:uncharacterized membrane protein YgcG